MQSTEGETIVIWTLLFDMGSTIVHFVQIGCMAAAEKDLEILILRKQLAIMERRLRQPPCLTRVEKLSLMVILLRLRASSRRTLRQLSMSICIVKPETILRWHRELVRWKWMRGAHDRLSKLLIINETHLRSAMRSYVDYYNLARPHKGIAQLTPVSRVSARPGSKVRSREILGGILHDYYQDTA